MGKRDHQTDRTMRRPRLLAIASAMAADDWEAADRAIVAAIESTDKPAWRRELGKLREFLADPELMPRWSVLATDGNSKEPFLSWSSLPGVFCPGAGDCLRWCYSFRAWRYPAAFCRQVQNTALLRMAAANPAGMLADRQNPERRAARRHIETALDAARPAGLSPVDFRLYVDGDFSNVAELTFWLEAIRARPWLAAYGYSKSWQEFLALEASGFAWPSNYQLNLSGGSKHGAELEARMLALPVTRGRYVVVKMPHKAKSSDHGDRAHQAALRQAYGRNCFTCPGRCGTCTKRGHACGSPRFRGVDIVIAEH